MTKTYNKTTTKIMFNTWLSNSHSKNTIGKVSHVLSLQNNKQTNLPLSLGSKQFSLPTHLESLPNNLPFFNRSFDKKKLKNLFSWYFANRGESSTFSLVETLQKVGFSYAMKAGISLGVDDLKVPLKKSEFLTEAVELLANTKASVNSGNVTALEEFQQFVDTWHRTSENLKTSVVQNFSQSSSGILKHSNLHVSSLNGNNPQTRPFISKVKTSNSNFFKNLKSSRKESLRSSTAIHRLPLFTCTGKDFLFYPQKSPKQEHFLHSRLQKEIQSSKVQYKKKQQPLLRTSNNILNPVYMMAFSGARGNLSQVRQLVGMRGLMADPQGQLVEFPIQSNFREGLTVTEYMISCYGARKGLVDTALRTAAAGYLTRRLVDVSHHQIVRFVTCGTKSGILLFGGHTKKEQIKDTVLPSAWKSPLSKKQKNVNSFDNGTAFANKKKDETKDPLLFCVGRVLARDIPGIAFRNQEIDIALATSPVLKKIYDKNGIFIRSPLTCTAETGICQLCYGWSVSANRLVGLGEAVGIIAAQSIGEPGTQLTMRTFHTGGVFSGDIMEECRAKHAGVVYFQTVSLGLLVRTAGGAIAFCLKTPTTLQIKGENEITSYNFSANTLLFVRQGETVLLDSLLAQIPNLPTLEENTGESTKTIVSELSGEVRQKATVNPQLASLRILAGQECTQFYFFNYQSQEFFKNQISDRTSLNKFTNFLKNHQNKEFISPFWSKLLKDLEYSVATYQYKKEMQQLEHFTNQKLTFKTKKLIGVAEPASLFQNNKADGLVKMIWGAHRLGKNQIFTININGDKAQVIVPTLNSPLFQVKFQEKKTKKKSQHESENNKCQFNWNRVSVTHSWKANSCLLVKTQLLDKLRLSVTCKIYSNRILITNSIKKNTFTKKQLLPLLSLDVQQNKQKQTSVKDLGLFDLVSKKKNIFPNLKGSSTSNRTQPLTTNVYYKNGKILKNFFVYCTKKKKVRLFTFNDDNLIKLRGSLLPLSIIRQNFLLSLLGSKNSFYKKQFSFNCNQLINTQTKNTAIHGIAISNFWPKTYKPNIFDYSFLFWTLQDLLFFRGMYTKTNQIFPQVQILINKNWWGHQKQSFQLLKKVNVKKKPLGLELVNFLYQSQTTTIIKSFPTLFLTLLSQFNIESSLNQFEKSQGIGPDRVLSKNLLSFTDFLRPNFQPKIKLQDSGEICPLQGNTNVTDFQKIYRSLKKITNLNGGLLMHYNRVSYKLPLCLCSTNSLMPRDQKNSPVVTKEQLIWLHSLLALWNKNKGNKQPSQSNQNFLNPATIFVCPDVPQIGAFLNTGDEILKECASAYCGQIIEKSPFGLTLRLTQNILYSNLRTRPAKINKNVKNGYWISKGAPLVTLPYISNVTGDIVAGIPKIEQLFEARGETLDETIDKIWDTYKISIVPRSKAVRECFKEIGLFVVAAIQNVYFSQGVNIADKHLEVIIRQMTRRALIIDPGDTEFLPDEFVDLNTIECVNWATYGESASYRPRLIGITKASLTSNSFLSSASFQQTARVLERETILEKTDRLLGLKERVMMGALINAGTGELKTTVQVADRTKVKSSIKLVKRLSFFSRRKVKGTLTKG